MLITSDLIRGHTETIILAQLMPHDSYGYEINKAIQEKTGGRYELKEATLYSAFRRLENAQLIRSYWGDENTALLGVPAIGKCPTDPLLLGRRKHRGKAEILFDYQTRSGNLSAKPFGLGKSKSRN